MAKSPSDFSCHSYETFVGQEKGNDDNNKEKMSIHSEGLESVSEMQRPAHSAIASSTSKGRKVSTVSMRNAFYMHVHLPTSQFLETTIPYPHLLTSLDQVVTVSFDKQIMSCISQRSFAIK